MQGAYQVFCRETTQIFLKYSRARQPGVARLTQPQGFQQPVQDQRSSNLESLMATYIQSNDTHLTKQEEIVWNQRALLLNLKHQVAEITKLLAKLP